MIFLVGQDDYLTSRIGTQMNVLHMGFAIWDNGQLYLRMASSRAERVLDVRLQDYLKTYLALGTLRGISVWAIKEIPTSLNPGTIKERLSSVSN